MYFVADFETTTNIEDCRVWGWGCCEIENPDNVYIGTTIDQFMEWCEDRIDNVRVYFHNLKFDGQFILNWLFENGFKHAKNSRERATKTFTTIISDKGLYYCIEVIFWKGGRSIKKVTFWDSYKIIPLSVEDISESFKMPLSKLKIDYDAHNNLPYEAPLTKQEKEYIINDVKIVAAALYEFRKQGLDKMTIGGCALEDYISIVGKKEFRRWFPVPQYHNDIKQSYKGGFSYLNPKFENKTVKNGIVVDVNSMFPYVMREMKLPFGTPILYQGKYEPDPLYDIYTQMIRCQFELKPGKIPTIQIKNSMFFAGNEYLTSSGDEEITLCLNSIDLELFLENYKVYNLEYISGWKFKSKKGMFSKYIDKWVEIKTQAKNDKNWGLYLISKLYLNSLYGKFGSGIYNRSKIPYVDENGVVKYKDSDPVPKQGVYIPVASFITSYARDIIIRAAQKIQDDYNSGKSDIEFIYADTDSLHCKSDNFELPEGLEIDSTKLGAFKFESKFIKAKYIRQKCYIEQSTEDVYNDNPEYKLKITVAGMPKECHEQVNFRNFKVGTTYTGKHTPRAVPGGVVLENVDFTIKK